MLCHLLENFDIAHVLTEVFWGFPCMFPDSPIGTLGLRNPPAHSLESAISKHLCRVWPLNHKKLPCAGPGQELSVNIAVPPLPELPLHKFHLCAIRWNRRKDTLILWIFQDLPVIRPNQTAREMMRRIEILVEHFRGLIFPSPQGQELLAKDQKFMPRFYLIL